MGKAVLNRIAVSLRDTGHKDRTNPSDSELLDRFRRNRDEEAFVILIRRHGKTVLAACRQILSDPADIDDAFQAAFLVLLQKIAAIDSATVGSWLYAVAHRVAVRIRSDARRRAKREGIAATRRQIEALPPDLSWREAVAILHEELDRLPTVYRRVLLLCYLSGMSREEAATNLGWSPGAVKGRLERARKMLANRLVQRGITLSVGLLAGVTGNSAGVDCPSSRLVELTVRAVGGATSPAIVALVRGVFPMANVVKKVLACVVAIAGLVALTGLGLAVSQAEPAAKTAPVTPPATSSKGDPPSPIAPEKMPEKAQSIRGIVKDSTGSVVMGATIIAGGYDGSGERLTTTSNADGRFAFDRFPSGQNPTYATAVIAAKEGFAPVLGFASPHNDREVVLTLPEAGKYAGTVKDRAGRAIVGAEVQFGIVNRYGNAATWGYSPANHLRGSQAEKFFLARTDAAGAFQFTTVPAGAELIFRATANGFAETDTAVSGPTREYVVGPNAKPAHLTLDQEAIIRGRVTSQVPGLAVKDVSVRLRSTGGAGSLYRFTKPDSEGRFEFKGLPSGPCGVYLVIPAGIRATSSGVTLAPKVGETSDANLEVVEGVEVTGVVRVRGGGQPVVGAEITAIGSFNPKGNDFTRPITDETGRFHLRLPPGDAEVMVWACPVGYSHPTIHWEKRKVTVPAGVKTLAIPEPFEMIRVKANLTGRVTDITGKPIPHVKISALKHSSPCGDFATDPVSASYDGQFALPYSPNGPLELGRSIPLRVELPDGRRFEANALVVKEGVAEVRLPTFPEIMGPQDVKPNEIAGIVVDEKGKPLAGVKVHMWDWVDKPENYTFTGPDGMFRFKDCGDEREVEVRFRKDGYSPVMIVRQQVGVKGLVIAMDRTTYFEGVVRGPNGKAAAGVVVRADQGPKILNDGTTTTPGCICTSLITETTTDAQGHYRLYVQPDEYAISVKAAGVGVVRLPKTGIAHGQARSFDIQLQQGVTFRARVLDSVTGKPVAGLRLFNPDQKDVDGQSDDRGEITIKDMLPGEFIFNVESDRYARWWSDQVTHEWERKQTADNPRSNFQRNFDGLTFDLKPGMVTVTIVAEPAVRVTGKVLDPNGKPVSGATVGPANGMWFWAETKADGTFALTLPASGATEYNLLVHDGKYDEWRTWANGVLPPIKTTPGQTIDGVTLKLTRPSVVRGKVVDENGLPVAGREVRAHAADRLEETHYLNPSTKTKADGTFELKFVRPAEQLIQVAPFWLYGKDAPPYTSRKLTLKEGQVVENVTLVCPVE